MGQAKNINAILVSLGGRFIHLATIRPARGAMAILISEAVIVGIPPLMKPSWARAAPIPNRARGSDIWPIAVHVLLRKNGICEKNWAYSRPATLAIIRGLVIICLAIFRGTVRSILCWLASSMIMAERL